MQSWIRGIVGAAACFGLAACATKPATGPGPEAESEIRTHCARLYANQAIDPVRDRILIPIPLDQGQPVEMLSNRKHPAESEKPAILALAKAFEACNEFAAKRVGQLPGYRLSTNDRIADALAELLAGDVTYGQFARTILYVGERDQLERQRLDEEIRNRERWRALHEYNGN
ncbi:MAG: hypothetical protein U1F52_13640 [Burkholderiales bacterium]